MHRHTALPRRNAKMRLPEAHDIPQWQMQRSEIAKTSALPFPFPFLCYCQLYSSGCFCRHLLISFPPSFLFATQESPPHVGPPEVAPVTRFVPGLLRPFPRLFAIVHHKPIPYPTFSPPALTSLPILDGLLNHLDAVCFEVVEARIGRRSWKTDRVEMAQKAHGKDVETIGVDVCWLFHLCGWVAECESLRIIGGMRLFTFGAGLFGS